MKKVFLAVVLGCCLVYSCKKESPQKGRPVGGAGVVSGGGSITGGDQEPSNATTFNGALTSIMYKDSKAEGNTIFSYAFVYFTRFPVAFPYLDNIETVRVGNVVLNGDTLMESNSQYFDLDNIYLGVDKWVVQGAGAIPSFSFQNDLPRPTAIVDSEIPLTISKSTGLSIRLASITNLKGGRLYISDGKNATTDPIHFDGNTEFVKITPAQMSAFQNNEKGLIHIEAENFQVLRIKDKNFRFSKMMLMEFELPVTD
jgi:hypothetical protein